LPKSAEPEIIQRVINELDGIIDSLSRLIPIKFKYDNINAEPVIPERTGKVILTSIPEGTNNAVVPESVNVQNAVKIFNNALRANLNTPRRNHRDLTTEVKENALRTLKLKFENNLDGFNEQYNAFMETVKEKPVQELISEIENESSNFIEIVGSQFAEIKGIDVDIQHLDALRRSLIFFKERCKRILESLTKSELVRDIKPYNSNNWVNVGAPYEEKNLEEERLKKLLEEEKKLKKELEVQRYIHSVKQKIKGQLELLLKILKESMQLMSKPRLKTNSKHTRSKHNLSRKNNSNELEIKLRLIDAVNLIDSLQLEQNVSFVPSIHSKILLINEQLLQLLYVRRPSLVLLKMKPIISLINRTIQELDM